jgi:hypothetical protein
MLLHNSAFMDNLSPAAMKREPVFIQKCLVLHQTKECSFPHVLLQTDSVTKQIVMTDKWLRSFFVLVSVAAKQST